MLRLWRIFGLRGWVPSECENNVVYIFRSQNLIQCDEIKISSKFKKFRTSGLLTAKGQKSQKWCIFAIFDPLRLAAPMSEIFKTCWKFFFRHAESDFGYEKFIQHCFHSRSAPTLLIRKSSIDITWETLRPGRDP